MPFFGVVGSGSRELLLRVDALGGVRHRRVRHEGVAKKEILVED